MDLHWTSCGIGPYLPIHWLQVRRMIVVEHAGIKISYWDWSSKSLIDKERFRQNGPASQHVRKKPTKNGFLIDFCSELTAWNPFSSEPPLPPKSLVDKRKMIVVEHVEICNCGICNCSCWTCIAQVVGFAVLVVRLHFLDLQLMDLHWTSCGIGPYLPNLSLIVRRMMDVDHAGIKIFYWVSSSKSLVDKRRFWQNGPASQNVRKEINKNGFLVDFCFDLTASNPFTCDLPLPPKSLVDKKKNDSCRACRDLQLWDLQL